MQACPVTGRAPRKHKSRTKASQIPRRLYFLGKNHRLYLGMLDANGTP